MYDSLSVLGFSLQTSISVIFLSLLPAPCLLWLPHWLINLACLIIGLGFLLWWPVFGSSHHCNITLYMVSANEVKHALVAGVAQVVEQAGL